MKWCERCSIYHRGFHQCYPEWLIWSPDDLSDTFEDAAEIIAYDAEQAAERWANEIDNEEGKEGFWRDAGIEVLVVKKGDAEETAVKYRINASVEYTATEA